MFAYLKKYRDGMAIAGILALMGAAICLYFLPGARWRAKALTTAPQQMTVRDLAERGAGENPYVTVTDFTCGSGYVFQIRTHQANTQPLHERPGSGQAWIPLFPKQPRELVEASPEPTSIVVLLQTASTLGNATDFHLLSRRASMTGLVVPYRRTSITGEIGSKLKDGYPDTNFDRCFVLEQYEKGGKDDAILFGSVLPVGATLGIVFGLPLLALAAYVKRVQRAEASRIPA
ncbi:hypothetical protein NA78x_000817 [Anatilimnocola sp. NA78]|uniref:hypothetical protein n=1 Tax=Anatilimnocola sp. NA78 TaxID=3415683 RepID=UPI003CE4D753